MYIVCIYQLYADKNSVVGIINTKQTSFFQTRNYYILFHLKTYIKFLIEQTIVRKIDTF